MLYFTAVVSSAAYWPKPPSPVTATTGLPGAAAHAPSAGQPLTAVLERSTYVPALNNAAYNGGDPGSARPGLLTGVEPATGKPAPYGSVGVDISCAVIGFTAKAPTADLAAPLPTHSSPRGNHGPGAGGGPEMEPAASPAIAALNRMDEGDQRVASL